MGDGGSRFGRFESLPPLTSKRKPFGHCCTVVPAFKLCVPVTYDTANRSVILCPMSEAPYPAVVVGASPRALYLKLVANSRMATWSGATPTTRLLVRVA